MKQWLLPLILLCGTVRHGQAQFLRLADVYPDKSRYAPSEPVNLIVKLDGKPRGTEKLTATIWQLDKRIGQCESASVAPDSSNRQSLSCKLPEADFQGYLVEVHLTDAHGSVIDTRTTAVDVSSDWKRFPRYGYLAHYNAAEGTDPKVWLDELNKFHINGLEFYDFQYRHDQPLAGTVANPAASWRDIAARPIDGHMITQLIDEAHHHNMMAMAYNASYSAYDDVFTRKQNPLPLQWGTWNTADESRTIATAKRLELHAIKWSTDGLFYMNQNDRGWQDYLYGQMRDLFKVYPFDGWHVDTFGEKGAYAFNRSYVNYVEGFPTYINRAHAALHKRIVFNAVNTYGQVGIAKSDAEFVYSELWEDHETFSSLLTTAEEVQLANPHDGIVFAAYLHRLDTKETISRSPAHFNLPAVLLTDAALFASGASHIELGDGDRMLSSEYFPADTRLTPDHALLTDLRHYYDFLTAYQNDLRDDMSPSTAQVKVEGRQVDPVGLPDTLWSIAKQKGNVTAIHLINLLGSTDSHWRNVERNRPEPPVLKNIKVHVSNSSNVKQVGWASPDIDGGKFHSLPFAQSHDATDSAILISLPELQYWDTIFLIAE